MTPLVRLENWEQRLNDFLAAHSDAVHRYGAIDCVLFPAAIVEALTGEDPGAPYRGTYDGQVGALRLLAKLGAESPTELIDRYLPRVIRPMARRGDIVMTYDGQTAVVFGEDALGICEDKAGFQRIPRARWQRAWRIG